MPGDRQDAAGFQQGDILQGFRVTQDRDADVVAVSAGPEHTFRQIFPEDPHKRPAVPVETAACFDGLFYRLLQILPQIVTAALQIIRFDIAERFRQLQQLCYR